MAGETNLVALVIAALFGLVFGSFLNVCIYRLPRGLSVVRPRSACPSCHTPIAARDNIPVLSWILLGGRCRHCHARITPRYMAVELLTAALFAASYYAADGLPLPALKSAVFCFLLVGLIFTDFETHLLPDALTLTGFGAGLVFAAFIPLAGPFTIWARFDLPQWQEQLRWAANGMVGAAFGAGFVYFAGWLYARVRGVEGMGLGDVKLMAMIGAFLGLWLTMLVLCLASLAGALFGGVLLANIYRKRRRRYVPRLGRAAGGKRAWRAASVALRGYELPFGVFLGAAALVSLFFGTGVLGWYMGFFGTPALIGLP